MLLGNFLNFALKLCTNLNLFRSQRVKKYGFNVRHELDKFIERTCKFNEKQRQLHVFRTKFFFWTKIERAVSFLHFIKLTYIFIKYRCSISSASIYKLRQTFGISSKILFTSFKRIVVSLVFFLSLFAGTYVCIIR